MRVGAFQHSKRYKLSPERRKRVKRTENNKNNKRNEKDKNNHHSRLPDSVLFVCNDTQSGTDTDSSAEVAKLQTSGCTQSDSSTANQQSKQEDMIKEVSYFEVHCDKCGCSLELDGLTAWCDEDEAQDALNYAGWEQHESERVYCDACIEAGEIMLNETDSYED